MSFVGTRPEVTKYVKKYTKADSSTLLREKYIKIGILPVLEMRRKTRSFPNTVEIIPRREYISDVIDYYKLACSSIDPYIQYISFYHIMEYFYDEIYKRKLVADLTDKITHPDFSYKDEDKVYEIATFVKNRMHATCFKKIFIVTGYTDLRSGIDRLADTVCSYLGGNAIEPDTLYLICGRRTDRIKGLVWENDGSCFIKD